MQYRNLGASGLRVPELSLDTGTFAGHGPLFSEWERPASTRRGAWSTSVSTPG